MYGIYNKFILELIIILYLFYINFLIHLSKKFEINYIEEI